MMRQLGWLVLWAGVSTLAIGCGDDGGSSSDAGVADAGNTGPCSSLQDKAPQPDQLTGPCCYRTENDPAMPTYRLAGLTIDKPAVLGNSIIRQLLTSAFDEERFNWLVELQDAGSDGEVGIRTGVGRRQDDGSYAFVVGDAPEPGAADRWDPVTLQGTLSGETFMAPPATESLLVPVFTRDGDVDTELPLRGLEIVMATMSEQRNCIGTREGRVYDTSQGSLEAFIEVETASQAAVAPLDTTLCKFIAGVQTEDGPCGEIPRSEWTNKPDALCTPDTGCTQNPEGETSVCDPAGDCNAWHLRGGFAAHSVTVE
jgi:hypothetical protein